MVREHELSFHSVLITVARFVRGKRKRNDSVEKSLLLAFTACLMNQKTYRPTVNTRRTTDPKFALDTSRRISGVVENFWIGHCLYWVLCLLGGRVFTMMGNLEFHRNLFNDVTRWLVSDAIHKN